MSGTLVPPFIPGRDRDRTAAAAAPQAAAVAPVQESIAPAAGDAGRTTSPAAQAAPSRDPEAEPAVEVRAEFPLEAFFVPADSQRAPSGYDAQAAADRLAARLEALAEQIRTAGLAAVHAAAADDELARAIAAAFVRSSEDRG
jgi:hypothetical protein